MKPYTNTRIFVVAPPRMLADEANVDIYYQVELPMHEEDSQLLQKRRLQKPVAILRKEMSIEGLLPEQLDVILSIRDAISNPRRNGLATLRQCSLSGTPQPEQWMTAVRNQVGGFPAVIRPIRLHGAASIGIVRDETEFRSWFRRLSNVHRREEFIVEEFVHDGYEFTAICSSRKGLMGCIASLEPYRTVLECIQTQMPYTLEFLSAHQTRDVFPGLESFAVQVIKSVFQRSYTGIIFIKGFYKDHNDIFFMGFSLEPECETFRSLMSFPSHSVGFEGMLVESLIEQPEAENQEPDCEIEGYHAVVSFPSTEGVLLHQTSIPRRKHSTMRVAWRAAEGHEMSDSDGLDDNVVQIYLTSSSRENLITDCNDIIASTDVTIDRNVLAERHLVCRRNVARLNAKELIRSCTTTD